MVQNNKGMDGNFIDGIISRADAPSGGNFGEYCKNSVLFTDRTCKQDGKPYTDGQLCPCFASTKQNNKEGED